ncbi:MAG: DUF4153 domain-containing protein [Bacteroidetes bacterium]|nr:DUF4153 domain-containing protein [Bacteroidota bacterium]
MKLPSLQQIAVESVHTLRRFPLVLAVAAVGTVAAIIAVEQQTGANASGADPSTSLRVLFAALLGVPSLTGMTLLAEKRRWKAVLSMILQIVATVLLAAYAWSLPSHIVIAPQMHVIRLFMLVVGMHLFVAIAPWLGRGEVNGFWQFNKTLFLRAFLSGLFTGVLYAGLAIALAAIENLFELSVPGERYGQLWILLTGMFMTWFFLAGIPEDLESLDSLEDYPKALKIFAQYVLLPLVAIYLVILVAYSGKIILAWSWPYGWVSRLILGFSIAGMFSLLLLYPIRDLPGNGWIRSASRGFYIVLAPLLLMYFLAVFERLSDYGITESRYIAIVTGGWLAVMVLYFLFSRGKNIKAIPLSLCVLAFLVAVGPWSAFSVSEQSQVHRLRSLMEKNGMFADGKAHAAKAGVPYADAKEISAVLVYLQEVHGYGAIQTWFDAPLRRDSLGMQSEWKAPTDLAGMLGIEFFAVQRTGSERTLEFNATRTVPMDVSGYDRVFPDHYFSVTNPEKTVKAEGVSYELNQALDTLTFVLSTGSPVSAGLPPGDSIESGDIPSRADTVRIALGPVISALSTRYHDASAGDIPLEAMTAEATGRQVKVKLYCLMLRLERDEGGRKLAQINLRVLYGRNPRSM